MRLLIFILLSLIISCATNDKKYFDMPIVGQRIENGYVVTWHDENNDEYPDYRITWTYKEDEVKILSIEPYDGDWHVIRR